MARDREDRQQRRSNIIQPGGLSVDTSLVSQPEGSSRFVLNGINNTTEGDKGFRTNDESNELCYTVPLNCTPLGQVYIGNENTLVFFVSNIGDSYIAIADRNKNLNVIVTDKNQVDKFGFTIDKQISATFRLRRGCERVVYWVDPKPRLFIIDKEEEYKAPNGDWKVSKFNLFKLYSSIPKFDSIDVLNSGGILQSGSYNFSIQYLDEDLNPTEFITSTEVVHIYNDSFTDSYRTIRGSSGATTELFLSTETNKAIKISLSALDLDFPFYRIAITESTNGSGQVSDTKYTSEISTRNTSFTYTGANYASSGTQEELVTFNNVIDSAEHIEQIENKLLLSNVKGKQINYCGLQRYASKIQADCVLVPTSLSTLSGSNSKKANAHIKGVAYMPGEIYSFGIVYVFEDQTTTPAYHIPGRSPLVNPLFTYSLSDVNTTYYPMRQNNISASNQYIDNDSCDNLGYWGYDSEGTLLKGQPVRHHRFPLRSEIGKPLYTETVTQDTESELHTLRIRVSGTIVIGTPCKTDPLAVGYDPNCVDPEDFEYVISYTVNGVTSLVSNLIIDSTWDPDNTPGQELYLDPVLSNTPIVINSVTENGVLITNLSLPSPNGLTYTIEDVPYIAQSEGKQYSSESMSIEFSNIIVPDLLDTGGQKIVGYYIVRNERTEEEKTILDSGVLGSTMQNKNFVSHGLLMPNFADANTPKIKRDFLGLINPEFKFNGQTYTEVDQVIKEGEYTHSSTGMLYSNFLVQDVVDGTSYDSKRHKKSESDNDGWDLRVRTKDNILKYTSNSKVLFTGADIKEIFYLDALTYRNVKDSLDVAKDVYNVSADNKIGIISLKSNFTDPIINTLPYVVLKRNIADSYSNFRTLPYYKETKNMISFVPGQASKVNVFNGDSYVTSMKYVNTVHYEFRARQRRTKGGLLSIIIGSILVAVGVVAAIFTGGTSLGLSAIGLTLLAGASAAAISAGALLASSGIKQAAWNKTYNELYHEGLRETVEDDFLNDQFKAVNPSDDEIRWFGEGLTNLWFESSVNMSLRQGVNKGAVPDFMDAPALAETGNGNTGLTKPANSLDQHMLKKLSAPNNEREDGREYLNMVLPEVYTVNPDYYRRNKQKIYNHLALEYDCCSDCVETFPHRTFYSEQSFQEELTDNYRTFLPNNYRDLEGGTGVITDLFRVQNNLYIHTEEALWHLPQNYQERVTGDIVSFLGTGEYFATPPRKIVDDSNSSAGTSHKWARLKTKYGVLFPSYREKKWYLFDGQQLKPISDSGMGSFFRTSMDFKVADEYYKNNGANYPYLNNPSNPIGVGYLSTYDTINERLLITKKDFSLRDDLGTDYELCDSGDSTTIFNNISQTIEAQRLLERTYIGIENCKLKFKKTVFENQIVTRTTIVNKTRTIQVPTLTTVTSNIFKDVDYVVFRYKMPVGATDLDTNSNLISPFLSSRFGWSQPNTANPYFSWGWDNTGTGLESILINVAKIKADFPLENFITFQCRAFWHPNGNGGPGGGNVEMDAIAYKGGTMSVAAFEYVNTDGVLRGNYVFAPVFINGPVTSDSSTAQNMGTFTYQIDTGNLSKDGVSGGEIANETITEEIWIDVPTEEIYQEAVTATTTIQVPKTTFFYIDGTPIELSSVNNGWTMSYSLEEQKWLSYHSFIPSFYFHVEGKFYSWKQNGASIWRHNRKDHYQTYYGVKHPFIIEYVDNSSALETKVWDGLKIQTEAKRYDAVYDDYLDIPDVTFNKILVYNTHQISGQLGLVVKSRDDKYLGNQVKNTSSTIAISRSERDWNINELRNIRIDYTKPMFNKSLVALQSEYYIDKIVNTAVINYDKDWTELESFRDKFLVVRLIFDTFDNTRLIMNFSAQDEKVSER